MLLESISLDEIDMEQLYFNPGCAMVVQKPDFEEKILTLLRLYYPTVKQHSICCHHDPQLPEGATIINNCAGCDRRFRSLYKGIRTISLWEILDVIPNLPLPDYHGMEISVHDSCSFRQKPQVHTAVRSLLAKMNCKVIEAKCHGTASICCGDNFYPKLPIEKVNELQKKRASQMPCEDVAVYCASCIKSMYIGGKKPHHMVDLLLEETTEPNEIRTDLWHKQVQAYIDAH